MEEEGYCDEVNGLVGEGIGSGGIGHCECRAGWVRMDW